LKVIGEEGPVNSENGVYETTAGRIIFNDILPSGSPFYNVKLDNKAVSKIIAECFARFGHETTIKLLDDLKELGFKEATLSGISFATSDLKMPSKKELILNATQKEVEKIQGFYKAGIITEGERYNQVIDCWTHAREVIGEEMMKELREDTIDGKPYLNPIYLMAASGARGSVDQIRQLAGIRGLMAKPSGKIIETPIKANFREGLRVLEYFSSTHGARKGLADTALKTADSGYLTRKLADVAQNVIITEHDCGTLNGIRKGVVKQGEKIEVSLSDNITGRVARDTIVNIATDEVIVRENEMITEEKAKKIEDLGFEKIRVRSPLTCECSMGICALCYGMDRSTGQLVEEGLAVGIIAAQSIGEPGTQLTMRTFHIGGTASRRVEESEIRARQKGKVQYHNIQSVKNEKGERIALNNIGEVLILDKKGRELERHPVPTGAILLKEDGQSVNSREIIVRWDPHMIPILAEIAGIIRYEDIVEGVSMREELDPNTGFRRKIITELKGDLHPQIVIEDKKGNILGLHAIPEKANVEVEEGQEIVAGTMLAKTPREITGTQDITGGLPRVTELFEARKPRDPAVISEIDGVVSIGEKKRGKIIVTVENKSGMKVDHLVPRGKQLRVKRGVAVRAGTPLVEGPLVPHDILNINGEEAVQQYLLNEVQNVYRSQSVRIDDKHIEIIIKQMMSKVVVEDVGDTDFLPYSVVDKFYFRRVNEELRKKSPKKNPAAAKPLLMGITKAALQSESFISAASFQETTKVLTEAAIAGKIDHLRGLKENVILGHLIPAGTGFRKYYQAALKKEIDLAERIKKVETEEEKKTA